MNSVEIPTIPPAIHFVGKGGLLQGDICNNSGDTTKVKAIYIFDFVSINKFREKKPD